MITINIKDRVEQKLHPFRQGLRKADMLLEQAAVKVATEIQAEIESQLTVNSAPRVITVSHVASKVVVSLSTGLGIAIEKFPLRQTEAGVEISVETGSTPQVIKGAFGPKIQNLRKGVFHRKSQERLPIQQMRKIYIFNRPRFQRIRDSLGSRLKEESTERIKESLK